MCGGVTLKSKPGEGSQVCFSVQMRKSALIFDHKELQSTTVALRQDLPKDCVIVNPLLKAVNEVSDKMLMEDDGIEEDHDSQEKLTFLLNPQEKQSSRASSPERRSNQGQELSL